MIQKNQKENSRTINEMKGRSPGAYNIYASRNNLKKVRSIKNEY